jgi:hypothetical protein
MKIAFDDNVVFDFGKMSREECIDRLSDYLIEQVHKHIKEVQFEHPGVPSGACFEGWAIQKIAELHYRIYDLIHKNNLISEK